MTRGDYRLEGFYEHEGRQHDLIGKVCVGSKGYVGGKVIDIDAPASVMVRTIRGMIKDVNGRNLLEFLVRVPGQKYCNVHYKVSKSSRGVEGTYAGFWTPRGKDFGTRITSGPHELQSGDSFYVRTHEKLVPHKKDMKKHNAQIILKRIRK